MYLYLRVCFYFHAVGLRAVRILCDVSCHFSSVYRPPADAVAFLCCRRKYDLRALGPGCRGGCDALCPDLSRVFQLAAVSIGVVKDASIADLARIRDGAVHHVVDILGQVIELDLLHIFRCCRLAAVALYFCPVVDQYVVRYRDLQGQVVSREALVGIPVVLRLYDGGSVDLERYARRGHLRAVLKVLELEGDVLFLLCLKEYLDAGVFLQAGYLIRVPCVKALSILCPYVLDCSLGAFFDRPVVHHEALITNCRQDHRLVLGQPSSGGKGDLPFSFVSAR